MNPIEVTEKAVNEIKRLQANDPQAKDAMLRVKVVGGGCSGMSYKLGFDPIKPADNDKVIEVNGVKLAIDSKSFLFIKGMTLDFSDGLNGKGFVFDNPNATKTCGCGNSFSA
jgi:iron-sulfur cluster assembly protein